MREFFVGETNADQRQIMANMVLATNGIDAATTKTLTVSLAKADESSYTDITSGVTVDEIGSGTYKILLATGHIDTEGEGMIMVEETDCITQFYPILVKCEPIETLEPESGYSVTQLIRLMSAALLGKLSGVGTGSLAFRDINDSKDRISATVDGAGNRTVVGTDAS